MESSIYEMNGYAGKEDYLNTLKEEYGDDVVDCLTTILPESEYFDGLLTALEDFHF